MYTTANAFSPKKNANAFYPIKKIRYVQYINWGLNFSDLNMLHANILQVIECAYYVNSNEIILYYKN